MFYFSHITSTNNQNVMILRLSCRTPESQNGLFWLVQSRNLIKSNLNSIFHLMSINATSSLNTSDFLSALSAPDLLVLTEDVNLSLMVSVSS